MSHPSASEPPLQFDRAEPAGPEAETVCAACSQGIFDEYYEANGKLLCVTCEGQVRAALTGGSRSRRWMRASAFGLGAGIVSAGTYYGVRTLTGYDLGLVALLVGWMVGAAVRRGSDDRGGLAYQFLAVAVAYFSIGLSMSPDVYAELMAGDSEPYVPVVVIASVLASFIMPALYGFEAPIGGIIFCFALFEAWRRNKKAELALAGPFKVQAPESGEGDADASPGAQGVG